MFELISEAARLAWPWASAEANVLRHARVRCDVEMEPESDGVRVVYMPENRPGPRVVIGRLY
jgi:hypothetical protein